MKWSILTAFLAVLPVLATLPSPAFPEQPKWPKLLLVHQPEERQAVVYLFDPSTPNVTSEIETYGTGGWDNKQSITGSAISELICREGWKFGCIKAKQPFNTVDVLVGIDDQPSHSKKKLHIDMNPFDGKHIMYLEPIRQAIWYMNLETRHAKLVLTSDNHTMELFAMDWTAGRLFTLHRTKGFISAWKLTSRATQKLYSFEARGVSAMACNSGEGALYWTTLDGSVYKSLYSAQGELRKVGGHRTCSSLASSIAEETRGSSRTSKMRPLLYYQGSMFCIVRKENGSTFDLVKIQELDLETEQEKLELPSEPGEFILMGVYTDWRSDPHYRYVSQTCAQCSHLCIPVDGSQKFECACPFGFNLLNRTTCENPLRLVLMGHFNSSGSSSENSTSFSMIVRDFMSGTNETTSVEAEEYFHVPTDVFHYFCLHFRNGNGTIECIHQYKERYLVSSWNSNTAIVHKVIGYRAENRIEWMVFYADANSTSLMKFTSEDNTTTPIFEMPGLNSARISIDHFNWRIYFSDTNGRVRSHDLQTSNNTSSAVIGSINQEHLKLQELFVDSYTSTLAILTGNDDDHITIYNGLNGRSVNRRVGFKTQMHFATLFEGNLLWIDGDGYQGILMANLDEFAGAEYLYHTEVNHTLLKLQYAVVDTRDSIARECSNRTCFHLCGATEPNFKCWCPKYDHNDCQKFRLLLELRKGTESYLIETVTHDELHSTTVAAHIATEESVLSFSTFSPRTKNFCSSLQRGLVIKCFKVNETNPNSNSLTIQKSLYGAGAAVVKFVTPNTYMRDYVYWISKFTKNGACLNVASASANLDAFELGCVLQTASKMEHPVYDVKRNLLFWCADSELKIYNFATSSLTIKPFETRCAGLSFKDESPDTIYALFRTKIQAFRYTVAVDDDLSILFPNVQLKLVETWRISTYSPAAFKITEEFFLWTDIHKNEETIVQALPFDQKLIEPVQRNIHQVTSVNFTAEILHFWPERKLGEDPCANSNCQFYCSVGLDNKPFCACPLAEATDFGIKYVDCNKEPGVTPGNTVAPPTDPKASTVAPPTTPRPTTTSKPDVNTGSGAVTGTSTSTSDIGHRDHDQQAATTNASSSSLWVAFVVILIIAIILIVGYVSWRKYRDGGMILRLPNVTFGLNRIDRVRLTSDDL